MAASGWFKHLKIEWDEREHPRKKNGELAKKNSVDLSDEVVPKSVGAKYRNYDITMPDGETAHLAEGTHITNKEVFAGAGTKIPIRDVDRLVKQYGGKAENWAKVKANATLELNDKKFDAEIHWYEEPTVGKQEMKVKPQNGGDWELL